MEFEIALGVDMSKEYFHVCAVNGVGQILLESRVDNTDAAIGKFIGSLAKHLGVSGLSVCLLCVEHTGIYNAPLIRHWLYYEGQLSVVAASKISSLLGGDQGWDEKSDVQDARRIAEYCIRFKDKLRPFQLSSRSLRQLDLLQGLRERLKRSLNSLKVSAKEAHDYLSADLGFLLESSQLQTVQALEADLKAIEQQMQRIIDEDEELARLFKLLMSVEGIGKVTATELLITTQAFTKFRPDEAKSFARYAGVVPKEWSSGKSTRRRSPHSKRCNQKVKALLTQGARSIAQTKGELGNYFRRKMEQGKPYMSVINALRNKIILRAFAVVRSGVMYEKNLHLCLDKP